MTQQMECFVTTMVILGQEMLGVAHGLLIAPWYKLLYTFTL